MPANIEGTEKYLQNLPKEKVYILDQMHKGLSQYSGIYQNFEKDIYNGLQNGFSQIKKYIKLVLLFSEEKQPQGLLHGFNFFCKKNNLKSEINLFIAPLITITNIDFLLLFPFYIRKQAL